MSTLKLQIELTENQAAALRRLCDKFGHSEAKAFLYPHLPADLRRDQAYDMVHAVSKIDTALTEKRISAWPWIDSGNAKETA
jgi:hypothetical protein